MTTERRLTLAPACELKVKFDYRANDYRFISKEDLSSSAVKILDDNHVGKAAVSYSSEVETVSSLFSSAPPGFTHG